MGMYVNPGNEGFRTIRNDTYVDKSEMIRALNGTLNTKQKLTCISRPRRFGKSYATQMLCAYYDRSCDSTSLFEDLSIMKNDADGSCQKHLNRYHVIFLDITNIMGKVEAAGIVGFVSERICEELRTLYPQAAKGATLDETLLHVVEYTGDKFIAIIDEWDALIRDEHVSEEIQRGYLQFLRMLFKSSGTTDKIFAAAYMTGILPIKKDGTQSAISDFKEYTMLKPRKFAPYIGFTQEEVKSLCDQYDMDFQRMKRWYDGYEYDTVGSIYNPDSVMEAIRNQDFDSYWKRSSAAESLMGYISRDYKGLSKAVAELLGGVSVKVNTDHFENDVVSFKSADDILTLLIHFGYLSYDDKTSGVCIPNEEIRQEFAGAVRGVNHTETMKRVKESDQLIMDTVHMKEEAVAARIEKIHMEEAAPLHYNNEQSLRSVIKLAYFSYKDHFVKLEELPAGEGYADVVYLPKRDSLMPILVIELKWNQDAEGAIAQIKKRKYPMAFADYGSEILLVGISYEKSAADEGKKHTCRIEKWVLAEEG